MGELKDRLKDDLTTSMKARDELRTATLELLGRATRGSRRAKALGKTALYTQLSLGQTDAYRYAVEVMASSSQTPDAQEGVAAFLEKRPPRFEGR